MDSIIGKTFTQEITVKREDTAAFYGSGKLEVFATPALVALMENSAVQSLEGSLADNEDSVGIEINVKHLKATAVNKKVFCKATVIDREGRRIRFEIEAWDESGTIGTAIHDRFIINPERFMQKLN